MTKKAKVVIDNMIVLVFDVEVEDSDIVGVGHVQVQICYGFQHRDWAVHLYSAKGHFEHQVEIRVGSLIYCYTYVSKVQTSRSLRHPCNLLLTYNYDQNSNFT